MSQRRSFSVLILRLFSKMRDVALDSSYFDIFTKQMFKKTGKIEKKNTNAYWNL